MANEASLNTCAADTSDTAIPGDNAAAWDSDDEPQQSEGSFAIADLLAGFSGPSSRANGSSLGPSRRDDAERGGMDVAVLGPTDYLLGDLGAPTQVCALPPTCMSTEPTRGICSQQQAEFGLTDGATVQDDASRSETGLTIGSSEARDRDGGLRSGAEVRAVLSWQLLSCLFG